MSKVSRSVYQKLSEENKRLLQDIRILTTEGLSIEKINVIQGWRNKFKEEESFHNSLVDLIRQQTKQL